MTDDDKSTPPVVIFGRHPAGMEPRERRRLAYSAAWPAPVFDPLDEPALAPWRHSERFAPPGPAQAFISALHVVIPLAMPRGPMLHPPLPTIVLTSAAFDESVGLEPVEQVAQAPELVPVEQAEPIAAAPRLPEPMAYWAGSITPSEPAPVAEPEPYADLTPTVEPEPYADVVLPAPEVLEPETLPVDEPEPYFEEPEPEPEPEPDVAPLAAEWAFPEEPVTAEPSTGYADDGHLPATEQDEALRSAVYWAEPPAPPSKPADSIEWTPPAETTGDRRGRATPAMAGMWAAEPADAAAGHPPQAAPGTGAGRIVRKAVPALVGVVVVAAACVGIVKLLPHLFVVNQTPTATFNAPMMVLRASGQGRIASIAIKNGQAVDPSTLLLTIHTEPVADPAIGLLQDQLAMAQAKLSALDQSLTQSTPNSDSGRAKLADLRRQRAAAANDVNQFQDGIAHIPVKAPADLPVLAGVHGVIRSLEAQQGAATTAGLPLIRILDCDHAFLTIGSDAHLQVGQTVQVRLPNLPPIAATVRKSNGIAEPPDALVIAPAPGAFVNQLSGSCPVGATATVTPSIAGS
ncbi:hypothetical protein [Acidisphaera sp. L21]|uniref:hypothetical protein n=1 Tax=Acidisphaera sp. L21 TaxID=1641851 RepID=UPI00131CE63D|nr:hypothetical protein [Acidisphaera sp. L21]